MPLLRGRHGLNGRDFFPIAGFPNELELELPQQRCPGAPINPARVRNRIGRAREQIRQPHLFGHAPGQHGQGQIKRTRNLF